MITRMVVDNFKALRHVEVDLAPFTVLIGPNDTGKTSFLESAYALSESTQTQLSNCFWSLWHGRELVHNQAPEARVKFTARLAGASKQVAPGNPAKTLGYSLELDFAKDRNCTVFEERVATTEDAPQGDEIPFRKRSGETTIKVVKQGGNFPQFGDSLSRVAQALPAPALARWDVEELAMPSRLPENRRFPFDPSGYGLSTCIAEMKLGYGAHFDALRDDFCAQFSAFRDIIVQRATVRGVERDELFRKNVGSTGEGYALVLLRKDGVEVPASLASGGTLITLAFLALIHLREPRKLLLIEEPENALHPGRLKELVPLLKRMIESRDDCQVVITTHSPLLLDHVDPSEVRVFLRNQQEDVEVYNLGDVPDIRERLNYLMLGELVYNEGEQALVKEIREHASAHSGRRAD